MSDAEARIRVALVDDHRLLALGLKGQLENRGADVVIAELLPFDLLVDWLVSTAPDVVVLDIGLPYDGGGIALIEPLVEAGVHVVNLTGESSAEMWARCFEAGALGVIDKSQPLDRIIDAVLLAASGRTIDSHQRERVLDDARRIRAVCEATLEPFRSLSSRESQVLEGLLAGLSPAQIADRDFVSVETIRTQVKSIARKLDVRSQLEVVAMAHRAGWSASADSS